MTSKSQSELPNRQNEILRDLVGRFGALLAETSELEPIARLVTETLKEALGAACCDLYIVRGRELTCLASLGPNGYLDEWEGRSYDPGDFPATAAALDSREVFVVPSPDFAGLSAAEREDLAVNGFASELCLPLLVGDRVVGLLDVFDTRPRDYAECREFARSVGQLAGGALANHLLVEQLESSNQELRAMVDHSRGMHLANLKALSWALNAKDYYTLGHAVRVSAYMALLSQELGWSPELTAQVEEAAYLHDIGKIGISDQVLLKPSRLNEREWELMRHHPVYGADTIGPLFEPELVSGVRHHHERYDGGGYPDGLARQEIPVVARAMCVADSYDAMSLRRPYRRALTYTESVEELKRCRGVQFDPDMTDAFMRVLERLETRRGRAVKAARRAARRIDVVKHAALVSPDDESRPEYREIRDILHEERLRHLPEGVMMTFARRGGRYVVVVDEGEDQLQRARIGDEVFAEQELPEAFAGLLPDTNALLVDQFGVWLGGRIPIMSDDGEVVAVVGADLHPLDDGAGVSSDVGNTLATMLQAGESRLKRTEFEAVTDGLTGLYSHRYFQERLGEELDRARTDGTQLSVLLCDIDDFKGFNERRGHAAGDRALHEISRVIENCGRRIDLAARYGGEQFALALIEAGAPGALEVAERIRDAVAEARVSPQGDRLTVSVGVATFPTDADCREGLIDKADWAMHLAKRQGRDTVAAFAEQATDTV